jgi:hypothetical protein
LHNQIKTLESDLSTFRGALDRLLSINIAAPKHFQGCFLELAICASRLYLDYLLVIRVFEDLESISTEARAVDFVSSDLLNENLLRTEVRRKLESSVFSNQFRAHDAFHDGTGLNDVKDYVGAFALHLPEVYQESLRAQVYASAFVATASSFALAQLFISLQHLARNHVGFVLQALERASDEDNWEDS